MIIKKIIGNLADYPVQNKPLEKVALHWDEAEKRILRKTTDQGREIGVSLEEYGRLGHGDILYDGPEVMIAIELLPAKAMVFQPSGMLEMAQICYQLGNRHAPVFMEGYQVLSPYDPTTVELFEKLGIWVTIEERRLQHALNPGTHHHH